MGNAELHFLYRDASNYKEHYKVVLKGECSYEQYQRITSALDEGTHFIPEQVDLTCNRFGNWTDDDTPFCEFLEIRATTQAPDIDMTWEELATKFDEAKGNWDFEGWEGFLFNEAEHNGLNE